MIPVTLLFVFIASFGLVLGTYVFISRRSLARRAAARRRIKDVHLDSATASLLRDDSLSNIPVLNEWLEKSAYTRSLQREIRSAGLDARPATVLLSTSLLATAGLLIGTVQGNIVFAFVYAVAGALAPTFYLRWKARRRIELFESQLPEALDMLINAMRAGYSFQAAMELVGAELLDPLGSEFAQFYEEQRLGMEVRTALLALNERIRSMDLKMFITAVLIQRETGGNLTEVLSNIATVVRERFRIQGELKTLTAQVNLSSKILGLLPIIVVAAITLINPTFMEPLFTTRVGHIILAIAAVSQVFGFLLMRKLSAIEI